MYSVQLRLLFSTLLFSTPATRQPRRLIFQVSARLPFILVMYQLGIKCVAMLI